MKSKQHLKYTQGNVMKSSFFFEVERVRLLRWASAKTHPPKLMETFAFNLRKHDLHILRHISQFSTG